MLGAGLRVVSLIGDSLDRSVFKFLFYAAYTAYPYGP